MSLSFSSEQRTVGSSYFIPILLTFLVIGSVTFLGQVVAKSSEEEVPSDMSFGEVDFVHYGIRGRDFSALKEQMRALGPKDLDGAPCYAFTRWNLDWKWGEGHPISFKNATVSMKIVVTLPEWENKSDAPKELQTRWDSFVAALKQHEFGHVRLAKEKALELRTTLQNLSDGTPVSTAQAVARKIVSEMYAADRAYDTRSKSGLTQGVLLE